LALEEIPRGLTWDTSGVGSKTKYALAVMKAAAKRTDLVVCTHVHLLPLAYAVSKLHRAPLILFVYGIEVTQPTSKWLVNRLISRVDALVSIRRQTTHLFEKWADLGKVRQYSLENAIRLERYGVGPKNPSLVAEYGLEGKAVIMTMGRVEESRKGFDEIIEVLPRLAQHVQNIVYVVAGGGYDVARLKEKANSLGVAERVVFTGFVPDEEKADYYRLADVHAMPGTGPDFDRYPLRFVFLEAMACGIPVVGARPEDPVEAEEDGSLLAEMVDPNDPDDIVRGILGALSCRDRRVPEGLNRFSFPEFQRRLHAIVDDVMLRA